jgi:hypothetical protein
LKDQLLLNGKNNLVLKQVALAMMQQHQVHPHQQTIITAPNGAQYAQYPNSNQLFSSISTGIPNGTLIRVMMIFLLFNHQKEKTNKTSIRTSRLHTPKSKYLRTVSTCR